MSEPEGFLARWTRLKREAERSDAEKTAQTDAAHTPSRSADDTPTKPPTTTVDAEPIVDLSALPPIDDITAATDIRAYLAPGVPAELTRAALRRAWVADPTIRDFIGIAENQWDFNDPNGIPGFGPLEDAGRLVAQLLGDGQARAAAPTEAPAPEGPAPEAPPEMASLMDADAPTTGELPPAAADQPEPVAPCERNMSEGAPIAAPQRVDRAQPARAVLPRGHGGALPK